MQTRGQGRTGISEDCRGESAEPPEEFVVAIIIIVFPPLFVSPPDRAPAGPQKS